MGLCSQHTGKESRQNMDGCMHVHVWCFFKNNYNILWICQWLRKRNICLTLSPPISVYLLLYGRGSYYTYSKRVLNFWIKTWWRSRNKWLHIYRQMHMSNNAINKQHMNTNCLMLLNEMSTHVKDCISFRGIDRHDPLDQCFDHSESGQD